MNPARMWFAALLLLAIGCDAVNRYIPTPATRISRDRAIEIALKMAKSGGPEIEVLPATPSNPRAELMTHLEAMKRYLHADSVPVGQDPDQLVWVVTMDGLWRDAYPRPTEAPTPELFFHYIIVLDAETGGHYATGATP